MLGVDMAVQVRVEPDGLKRLEAGMPALRLDGTLGCKRMLRNMLGVPGPRDVRGKLIVDGLVRLVDKTINEYHATRVSLQTFFPSGYLSDYHRAQDHFESCVQSLHRAITYLDRLRALGYARENGLPLVPRPRQLEALRDPVKTQVRKFRDYLEHLDEAIIQGRYATVTGEVGPQLGCTSAAISDASLTFVDMARWIEQLFGIAAELSYVAGIVRPAPTVQSSDGAKEKDGHADR